MCYPRCGEVSDCCLSSQSADEAEFCTAFLKQLRLVIAPVTGGGSPSKLKLLWIHNPEDITLGVLAP